MTSASPLPRTLEAAHAEIVSAQNVIATLSKKLSDTLHENELLRQKIDTLCRRYFNSGSEKVSADQLAFAFAKLAEAESVPATTGDVVLPEPQGKQPKPRVSSRPTGRQPFPPHLARRRVVISAAPEERHCHCGDEKQVITEKTSERLGYEPGSFYVEEIVREVSVCKKCHDGVTVPPMPPQAIEGCAATSGLLAHIVVSKYVEHLPLYRLERQFQRMGVELSRSTLCSQLELVEEALAPLGEEIAQRIRAGPYIQFDDTSVRVLTEREGERYYGKVWVYLSPGEQLVAFDATTTREHTGPLEFLRGFCGDLQGDAFSGNLTLRNKAPVRIIGCMTHLRRKFVEALEKDPRAAYFVAFFRRLYDIEEVARPLSPEQRRAMRQAEAKPILRQMALLGRQMTPDVLPKSALGEALTYLRNQARYVFQYIRDGRLEIDNNGAERQLRGVAIGRKNWLFAGSMKGLRRAALLYSLVQSCKLVGVEPWAYLKDVLDRLPAHPQSRIGELLPKAWAAAKAAQEAAPTA